jgi:hypothetical protein
MTRNNLNVSGFKLPPDEIALEKLHYVSNVYPHGVWLFILWGEDTVELTLRSDVIFEQDLFF